MDNVEGFPPHKYDTYIPLDYPPMKIGNIDYPNGTPANSIPKPSSGVGVVTNNIRKSQPPRAEEFMCHLGALRRG